MHTIAEVSIMFAALLLCTNGADAAPWCADYGFGGTNCGFYSFEQCQAARSGNGGFCSQNSIRESVLDRKGLAKALSTQLLENRVLRLVTKTASGSALFLKIVLG